MTSIHPLYAEALATFDELQAQAFTVGEPDPTAMYLATASSLGRPSLRTVLLKSHGPEGFVFYTHTDGRKGLELSENPFAALLFHWPRVKLGVQIRIEGSVSMVSASEADAYFASRPRESQLGAWASQQSRTLASREVFDDALASFETRFAGADVPRPEDWTGFRVEPSSIEIWYAAEFRLHERYVYECSGSDWTKRMLYP